MKKTEFQDSLRGFRRLPEIKTMGDKIFEPHWAVRHHQSRDCELLYVMEGRVRTVLPPRRGHDTGPGGLVLIPPATRHRDEFDPQTGLKVFMVSFHWPDAARFFRLLPRPAGRLPGEGVMREIEFMIRRLRALLHSGTEIDRMLSRACLLNLLMTILHEQLHHRAPAGVLRQQRYGQRRRHQLMLQARRYLDQHYTEEISLEHLARTLQISPFYLSHIFSQQSDFSLSEYLTNLRMQQAKLLLQGGRHSIKEAAHAVGYNDGNYFTKVFRRYFGFTPRDLRDASRGRSA